jgi:hypothetical protein
MCVVLIYSDVYSIFSFCTINFGVVGCLVILLLLGARLSLGFQPSTDLLEFLLQDTMHAIWT